MHKYAVYGNEEITSIQVAKNACLDIDECIFTGSTGRQRAKDCKKVNPDIIIIGPERECDLCKGLTHELKETRQNNSIAGNRELLICDYCYHSIGAVFYDYEIKSDLMRHINNMFNLFEKRIKTPGTKED